MSVRSFVDSDGREWLAFDVVPRTEERRRYDRRISGETRLDADRRDSDRRLTVGSAGAIKGGAGWLCFESGQERRRLTPIPDGWHRVSDEMLESYCRSGQQVPRVARPTEEAGDDSAQLPRRA